MKKLIAAAVIALSTVSAYANPFDFERQIGTVDLFPTLIGDSIVTVNGGAASSSVRTYERDIGAVALYPTLVSEQVERNIAVGSRASEPFSYWASVWHTDVAIGG